MKTTGVCAVVLLVALFAVNESKPFGRRRQDNRQGDGGEDGPNPPDCPRRCPRPTRRSHVCVFDETRKRTYTFGSECRVERLGCLTGRKLTILSQGTCPRIASQVAGRQQQVDSESEEDTDGRPAFQGFGWWDKDSESEEITDNGGMRRTTTSAPLITDAPTQPATTAVVISRSGTVTFALRPGGSGTSSSPSPPGPPGPVGPEATAPSGPGTPLVSSSAAFTGTRCNTLDSCPPSSFVCGTDGQTYASQCVLEVTACVNGLDTLTVAYAGPCIP